MPVFDLPLEKNNSEESLHVNITQFNKVKAMFAQVWLSFDLEKTPEKGMVNKQYI